VITTGQHVQVKKIDVSTPGWNAGRDWHSEYEITIAGKNVDKDELKNIFHKGYKNSNSAPDIDLVYEIAPDDVLFTLSNSGDSNRPQTVIARAKYSDSGDYWHVMSYEENLCLYPGCIFESKIPGWIEIQGTTSGNGFTHLIDKHSLRAISFAGKVVKIDHPYVVVYDMRTTNKYENGQEFPEENLVLQVMNMQSGQIESELKLPKACFALPARLDNVWNEFFIFDREKKVVELKKEQKTNLLKSKSRAERNSCEEKFTIANGH
jgi:hypothetical protein